MSQGPEHQQPQKPPTSTLAIVSLITSFLCWPVFLGLILGIVSLVRINKSDGKLGGKTLAIIAIVMNLCLIPTCGGIYAAIAIPNFIMFQCRSKQSEAKGNLKALHVAEELYRGDKDSYTQDLGALEFKPMGQTIRYDYVVVEASREGFRAEARGKGDMAGDVWAITNANDVQNVQNKCRSGGD
ncbi:MAG: hypothetical protein A2138_26625 [Deltaproteobacteria bacterium RBG_16_71_12]|nr:MAG: hypothetical protein A2138_26625 [Deltaproteobacteria bacterium RBG_16_71_12]